MRPAGQSELTTSRLDAIAWDFLGSEFAEYIYDDWPMDRRVDAFLRHEGRDDLVNDGDAYDALLQRVMANLGRARRQGRLASPNN
jgi:hypothetical protein